MNRNSLLKTILDLEQWVAENDYSGYDPYDGLRSRLLNVLPLPGKYPKIAWIQFFKHCPVNLRTLFLIPKGRNPKGMGLFLSAYVYLYRATGETSWLDKGVRIAEWLEQHACKGYSGTCWGYNFDWQSRAFFVPLGTPTIVNTSFIGHAFLDLFQATGNAHWLNIAASACQFILNDLNRYENGDHLCFSYTPIDDTRVHNANLLGCSLLARVSTLQDRSDWQETIRRSARYSLDHQRADGAWYYAETDYQSWVDSFHTGFNLMSLQWIAEYLPSHNIAMAVSKGETFYAENFFLAAGTPKYFHDRVYPLDIHSPAMALRYFGGSPNHASLCAKVFDWICANMRQPNGTFAFQENRVSIFNKSLAYRNKIPYMRWGQAWALYGLSWYLASQEVHRAHREPAVHHIANSDYETTLH